MADEEKPKSDKKDSQEELDAKESFQKGLGLLWRAARSAADEIKREVEKGGVRDSLKQAGRELEAAAQQAARTLEGVFDRIGPDDPKPEYSDSWPPKPKGEGPKGEKKKGDKTEAKQVDADIPPDGGKDEKGERRDMRIQLDDDDES